MQRIRWFIPARSALSGDDAIGQLVLVARFDRKVFDEQRSCLGDGLAKRL